MLRRGDGPGTTAAAIRAATSDRESANPPSYIALDVSGIDTNAATHATAPTDPTIRSARAERLERRGARSPVTVSVKWLPRFGRTIARKAPMSSARARVSVP